MIVDCAAYADGKRCNGKSLEIDHALEKANGDDAFVWIGLYEPTEDEFDSVKREFNLHELAVEDAIHAHQRPKLELYGDTIFVVLKTARYVDSDEVIELGEILIFIGDDFIVTVRHGEPSDLHAVREQVESDPEVLKHGPAGVLHAIVDKVVDDYGPALEGLEEDITEVEDEVFSPVSSNRAERIYKLKREVLQFLKASSPLSEPMQRLAHREHPLVPDEVRAYFRDVTDHLARVQDQLEGFRDLLTSVLEANLSQVGVRQNEDMRKISSWVAIAAVPTMIAGIYGMNFEHMPELGSVFGYPAVLLLMLGGVRHAVPDVQEVRMAVSSRRQHTRAALDRRVVDPVRRVGGPVVVGGQLELVHRAEGHRRIARAERDQAVGGVAQAQARTAARRPPRRRSRGPRPAGPRCTGSSTPCPRPPGPAAAASRPCPRR